MKNIKRDDCDQCLGTGKIKLIPWTDAPIWERENEAIEVECDICEENI